MRNNKLEKPLETKTIMLEAHLEWKRQKEKK